MNMPQLIFMVFYSALLVSIPFLLNYIDAKKNPEEAKTKWFKKFKKDTETVGIGLGIILTILILIIGLTTYFGNFN